MCGYVAVFKKDSSNLNQAMGKELLSHRGPDEKSILVEDNFVLGFWRLSIVDIEKGNQPMEDKISGRYFFFCSSVPKAIITGDTIEIPKAVNPGALAAAISLLKRYF